MNRFASPLSLIVAAIMGGLVSQGISRWMPEAHAQDGKQGIQDDIRVKRIVVIDDAGNDRIILETKRRTFKLDGMPDSIIDSADITVMGPPEESRHSLSLAAGEGFSHVNLQQGMDLKFSAVGNNHGAFLRVGGDGYLKRAPIRIEANKKTPAAISLSDGKQIRAVMGITDLETIQTGESQAAPSGLLTLFDKDGKVIWKAP